MNLSHVFVDTAWVDLPYPHTPVSMLTLIFFPSPTGDLQVCLRNIEFWGAGSRVPYK